MPSHRSRSPPQRIRDPVLQRAQGDHVPELHPDRDQRLRHLWPDAGEHHLCAEQTNRSRKSVALYFYTRDRPGDETAGKHSTHYVNRQLHERYAPGYTLDAADVVELRELIAHRDNRLQQLFAENANLLQAQERGLSGKFLYLLKRLYVRYRH